MTMIVSTQFELAASTTDDALARVPARTFGETDWVTLALKQCAAYLQPAIAGGKPYQIANALRAVMHVPSAEQVGDVIEAVCDTVLADAYSTKNARQIANVTQARPIVASILTEFAERTKRAAAEPAALRETIDGYVRMAALADKQLAVKLDAVGALAIRIAVAMHQPDAVLRSAECAGRLHDVGMIGVPRERGHRSHTILGASCIESIPSLAHLAPIVRSHHEHYDGTGFPDGLRAEEIPIAARIIAVAARFFELVTSSPRHEAMSPNDACHEIAHHAGSAFDPGVVDALLDLLDYRRRTNRSA